jgi:malate synthase
VPLHNLMEDAATAEISRSQIWQWIRHKAHLDDGRLVEMPLCEAILADELAKLKATAGAGNRYEDAAALFRELIAAPSFVDFLTLPAYDMVA